MSMPAVPVLCQTPGCGAAATYKVASEWSDGSTIELKTYALCCRACLAGWYDRSLDKQRTCRLTVDERLERPGIYERLPRITRRPELEA